MIRWSEERIIQALRDWEAIFGSPPIAQDWVTADHGGLYPSAWTVRAHFGSLRSACLKAGLAPRPVGVNKSAIAKYLPLRRETA